MGGKKIAKRMKDGEKKIYQNLVGCEVKAIIEQRGEKWKKRTKEKRMNGGRGELKSVK